MMLPNGWKKIKLGEICNKIGSGSTPKGGREVYLNAGIPIIRSQNVLNGFLDLNDVAFISDEQHSKMKGTWVHPNDILLNITGASIGRSCVVPATVKTANVNQHVCIIRLKECADACYVCNLILSKDVQKQIELLSVGGGRQGLNFQQIASFSFLLPPLEEQKKIAATLSVWDTAIEKMEKLLEAKIVQKNSLTYKLIENQYDVKFKLGNVTIDKSKWEKKSLKEFGSFSKGQGIKRDEAHSGSIAAVRYGEIYTTHNDYIKEFHSFISEDVAKKSKLLKKGDLLFSCSGETKEDIGKCVAFVSNVVAYAGGDIIIFSPQIECDSKYLGFLLNARSINKQKYGLGQGDSIVHISAESIGRLTVFLPSYPEQKAIADVLSAIDDELFLLKQQLENYKRQKQGLMQKLLTGQWRVK